MKLVLTILPLLALPACATDKLMHAGVGGIIGGVGTGAGLTWQQSCGLSIAAGVGKEVYDGNGRGTVDGMDAVSTALTGCAIAYIIEQLNKSK